MGIGKIARDQHLPAIAADPALALAAIVSGSGDHGLGVPAFADLAALAASGIAVDAVALCTPPAGRHTLVAQALQAGWHVLMEKPPGATVSELVPLPALAQAAGRSLYASWHSREAAGIAPARDWLTTRTIRSATVHWREDIRQWHPGQEWILGPGGLGVFDPGINALSILTAILPGTLAVAAARLIFPTGRDAPIAAAVGLALGAAPIAIDLEFRETADPRWQISVDTDAGVLELHDGGARLVIAGDEQALAGEGEYPRVYRRFAELIGTATSDLDVRPLQLVADAFLIGSREEVEPFAF